jgi:hypothetical protein
MGIYDTYGRRGVQLKVGDPSLNHFKEGDEVNIADGVYLGYEGAVVIIDGKLAKVFNYLKDKWGGKIRVKDIIDPANPIAQSIQSLKITGDINNGDAFATKVAKSTPRQYNKKSKKGDEI